MSDAPRPEAPPSPPDDAASDPTDALEAARVAVAAAQAAAAAAHAAAAAATRAAEQGSSDTGALADAASAAASAAELAANVAASVATNLAESVGDRPRSDEVAPGASEDQESVVATAAPETAEPAAEVEAAASTAADRGSRDAAPKNNDDDARPILARDDLEEDDAASAPAPPSSRRRRVSMGTVVFWALLVASIAGWAWYASLLREEKGAEPQRAFEEQVERLRSWRQLDVSVAQMCQSDEGRGAIKSFWRDLEKNPEQRDRLERALFQQRCLKLLSEDVQTDFFSRHGAWALEASEKLGASPSNDRLMAVLGGETPAAIRRAAGLLEARLDRLDDETRAAVLKSASEAFLEPWGLSLLEAMNDGPAIEQMWFRYKQLRALSGSPVELPALEVVKNDDDEDDGAAAPDGDGPQDAPADPFAGVDPRRLAGVTAPRALTGIERRRLEQLHGELMERWRALPEEAQEGLIRDWLSTRWVVRWGGTKVGAQPIMFEVRWRGEGLEGPLHESVLFVGVKSFTIDEVEAQLPRGSVASVIGNVVMGEPSHWRRIVDITDALQEEGRRQITASAEVVLLPAEARGESVQDPISGALLDAWRERALYQSERAVEPQFYRVYNGVNAGPPKTIHDRAKQRAVEKHLEASLRIEPSPVSLRSEGKSLRPSRTVEYHHRLSNEILLSHSDELPIDLAYRVQGKAAGQNVSWWDLGEGVFLREQDRATLAVDLSPVCREVGPCAIDLRLRPSLRVARTDPRIDEYLGESVTIGTLSLDVKNPGRGAQWPSLQARLRGKFKGADEAPPSP